jgi:hypothetical protein
MPKLSCLSSWICSNFIRHDLLRKDLQRGLGIDVSTEGYLLTGLRQYVRSHFFQSAEEMLS